MEEIIIQNGSVCLRSVQELKRIRTEDFYQSLSAQIGMHTPILPERTLYYGNRGEKRVYCIYRVPETAVISVKGQDEELLSAPTENVPIPLISNVPISPTDNKNLSSRRTNLAGS